MSRKVVFALLLILALVVTACAPATAPGAAPAPAAGEQATATAEAGGEAAAAAPSGESVTLTIESWRNDDLSIWQDTIIPAFEAKNPGIKVVFSPAQPAEYNAALNTKLEGGTAGDLITCRPFDASLALFDKGYLAELTDLPGMENFSDVAKSAWVTDDGKQTFCVPMASVIHGFIYNKDYFDKLGLTEPKTEAEFFALLDKIKADGTYDPSRHGHRRPVGVRHHGLPEHRPQLLEGRGRPQGADRRDREVHRPAVRGRVGPARQVGRRTWPTAIEAQTYADSQNLFTLGKAAIYPAGSWDISLFNQQADFAMGAFPPPLPEGAEKCYISDHTDIALGMNAATKNAEAAKTFLSWVASSEFADLYSNSLPGFYSLSKEPVTVKDPLAPSSCLAQRLRSHDSQLLPDPVARRAQPGERAVACDRRGDEHDARPG